ncbi:MAG: acyltransferase family protein [Bacilli bacterium]|jgi:fucose 4-O-acetylase-like acetyltransferase|nr:acyltransferase family protein [Bacilli bacterium]
MEKKIDYFMENSKVILIFLVVIGHFTVMDYNFPRLTNLLFTSFRMPAFIFVCGYFAKRHNLMKDLKKLLVPYLILQVIWFLYNTFCLQINDSFFFFRPAYTLWFLLSIFTMKQLVHFIDKLKYPLFTLFFIAIIAGYTSYIGTYLSLSRTIVFFPFFYMGFKFKRDQFVNKTNNYQIKALAILLFIVLFIILYNNQTIFTRLLFFGNSSYSQIISEIYPQTKINIYSGLLRVCQYIFSTIAMYCFFVLVPKEKNKLSYIGHATLGVYIVHPFIVQALRYSGFYKIINNPFEIIMCYVIAIIITLILSTKTVNKYIRYLFKIPIEKLFKKEKLG